MKLHDYQKRAIDFVLAKKRCALFMGLGLGKSLTMLCVVDELLNRLAVCKPLVIAPRLLIENTWPAEIKKWGFEFRIASIHGNQKQRMRAAQSSADIYLISVDNLSWLIRDSGLDFDYDMVICDESTKFKTHNSKRTKSLRAIRHVPEYFVCLSGTPIPNGYQDLWSQIQLIDGGERLGKTITRFRNLYMHPHPSGFGWNMIKAKKDDVWAKVKDIALVMRTQDYLPPDEEDQFADVYFHLNGVARAEYQTNGEKSTYWS